MPHSKRAIGRRFAARTRCGQGACPPIRPRRTKYDTGDIQARIATGSTQASMLVYLIRRLGASIALLFVMSLLVFGGVYAIGNPVDLLISPEADQQEVARAVAALGGPMLPRAMCSQGALA